MIRFNAELFKLASAFQGIKDIRYYLNGVKIEPHPEKGAVAIATDGHMMGVVHDENGICTTPMIIRCPKALMSACKAPSKIEPGTRHLIVVDGRASIHTFDNNMDRIKDGEIFILPNNPEIEGLFPNWRHLVPNCEDLEQGMAATISAPILKRFVDVATTNDRFGHGLIFWQRKEGDKANTAVLVQFAKKPEFVGIVMPMRDDIHTFPPRWAADIPVTVAVVS